MKTVRVGYSRVYNASHCNLLGRDEVSLRFRIETIIVEAYVGPNPRHLIMNFSVGPPEPITPKAEDRKSRARGYDMLSPKIFPADLYTELVATQEIEIDDALSAAFHGRDAAARSEVFRQSKEKEVLLITALDYVAGVLGLCLHYQLVRTPLTEQRYAYRDKDAPYALSAGWNVTVMPPCNWDVSNEGITAIRSRLPQPQGKWTWEEAAKVLAWLLRAWAAEDPILEFVSLFIPLECVIPKLSKEEDKAWNQKRNAVIALIKKVEKAKDRDQLFKFLTELRPPQPSLVSRFKKWATDVALLGWEHDIAAFTQFNKMRNSLVHAGKKDVESRVTVAVDDVRTLEDIAGRYMSLALFGDANVYRILTRRSVSA